MPAADVRRALSAGVLASFFDSISKAVKTTLGLGGDANANSPRSRPGVYVAAFGKHPGWDDHIDELGVETDVLVHVKRLLYTEGIGGNIDTGTWERLGASERLERFDHGFVWKINGSLVVGRLWSSTDGKGRARYPMVIAAECSGLPAEWALEHVPARLEALQQACLATRSADDVRAAVNKTRQDLRNAAVAALRKRPSTKAGIDPVQVIARCPDMGENHAGLLSVLYEIEHDMASLRPGAEPSTKTSTSRRFAHHLRVPACAGSPYEAMHLWIGFMHTQIDRAVAVLAIQPLDQPWLDVMVGDPTAADFATIRESRKKVTFTTDIPYALTDEFRQRAVRFIGQRTSRTPGDVRTPGSP